MRLKTFSAALLLCSALSLPLSAQTLQDARDAFNAGDYATALAIATPFAEAGEPIALNILGVLYEEGRAGLAVDIPRALELYERAADAGWGPAINNLGLVYLDGLPGVPADPVRAFEYFDRGHKIGYSPATVNLAHLHWDGIGTEVDLVEARQLLETAAADGNRVGLNDLGVMLADGLGGPQDVARATELYRAAAELGLALGGMNYAVQLLDDPGVTPEQRLEGLAWCLWAGARAGDDAEIVAEDCAPRLEGVGGTERAAAGLMSEQLLQQF